MSSLLLSPEGFGLSFDVESSVDMVRVGICLLARPGDGPPLIMERRVVRCERGVVSKAVETEETCGRRGNPAIGGLGDGETEAKSKGSA